MSNAGNEAMRFDIDGEPVAFALKRIGAEMKNLQRQFLAVEKDSSKSTEAIKAQQEGLIKEFVKLGTVQERLTKQHREKASAIQLEARATEYWNSELRRMDAELARSQRGFLANVLASNKMGMSIGALSYAVDDFVTVAQMQNWTTEGMVAGLRAASNNISVLLMAYNPMLAIVPSATTALIGFATKGLGAVEKASEKTAKKLETLEEKIKAVIKESEGLHRTQEENADIAKIEEMNKTKGEAQNEVFNLNSQENEVKKQIAQVDKDIAFNEQMGLPGWNNNLANKDKRAKLLEQQGKIIVRRQVLNAQIEEFGNAQKKIEDEMEVKRNVADIEKNMEPVREQAIEGVRVKFRRPNADRNAIAAEVKNELGLEGEAGDRVVKGIVDEADADVRRQNAENKAKGILKLPEQVRVEAAQKRVDELQEQEEKLRLDRPIGGRQNRRAVNERAQAQRDIDVKQAEARKELDAANKDLAAAVKEGNKNQEQAKDVLIEIRDELRRNRPKPVPGANGNNFPPG